MQTLVEKYLDKGFLIKKDKGNYCLFNKFSDELVYPIDFIYELTTVLTLPEDQVVPLTTKWGVKRFGKKIKKYWAIIKPNLDWEGIAMPMVRRVSPKLLANDIVSVQAMNIPSGQLLYYDNSYNTGNTQTTEVQHVRIEPEGNDGGLFPYEILTTR